MKIQFASGFHIWITYNLLSYYIPLTPRSYVSTLFPRPSSIIVFSEIPISYSCAAHDGYVACHDSILLAWVYDCVKNGCMIVLKWVYDCVKINIPPSCKFFNNPLLSNPQQHFRN
jgi:hypothetical protein